MSVSELKTVETNGEIVASQKKAYEKAKSKLPVSGQQTFMSRTVAAV